MPHTEEQIVDRTLGLLERTEELVKSIYKAVSDLIEERADSKMEKELAKYLKQGGTPGYVKVSDYYNEVSKRLTEQGIPHMMAPLKDKEGRVIFVKASDVEKTKDMYRDVLKEKGLVVEVTKQEMLDLNYGKNLNIIPDLDVAEMQTLREKAQRYKVMIAIEEVDEKYKVYYKPEQEKEMSQAISAMTWELTGERGHTTRKQIEHDVKNKADIYKTTQLGGKDICITSGKNSEDTIKLTQDGYVYMKENRIIEECSLSDPHYEQNLWGLIEVMDEPVILSEAEYNLPEEEREILIREQNEYPRFSDSEWDQMKIEMELTALIQKKMSLWNVEQHEVVADFFNHDVNFTQFYHAELQNKEHLEEDRQQMKEHFEEFVAKMDSYPIETFRVNTRSLDQTLIDYEEEMTQTSTPTPIPEPEPERHS